MRGVGDQGDQIGAARPVGRPADRQGRDPGGERQGEDARAGAPGRAPAPDLEVALDVWEGEPQADPELAAHCLIATPHIAGYSLEGKLRGTAQIYQAYCAWRGIAERVSLQDVLPETWLAGLQLNPGCDPAWALATLCRAVYDPRSDDAAFRRSLTGDSATRRAAFDALRKHYPPRREITGLRVATGGRAELQRVVRALGAQLV